MTSDDLDTKSLEELDEIFAVEVDGYTAHQGLMHTEFSKDGVWLVNPIRYSAYAGEVLPWLEKCGAPGNNWVPSPIITFNAVAIHKSNLGWNVDLGEHNKHNRAPTFPHAAVLALIRAERAKKGNP